ncbi:MAG: single-stranded-DNA-specific exonuclease RecJ [Patescibacteria group bacterium]
MTTVCAIIECVEKPSDKKTWIMQPPMPAEFFHSIATPTLEAMENRAILAQLLWNRGIRDEDAAARFLAPDYARDIHDPMRLKNMDRAVERINRAAESGEKTLIFSDYDADGVCGAAVLGEFFRIIRVNHDVHMPDRTKEAYGLSEEKIRSFFEQGITLLITIDCGVTDYNEIELARSLGIDTIVIDHHIVPPRWPNAYAIVDHKQEDETYPEHVLSGAGLAFKLVQALIANGQYADVIEPGREKWLLDCVAIAAVADMVPLTGENRALVAFGLKVLRKMRRRGLAALLDGANIAAADIDEETIGFTIAPRINAASRMAHARMAFDLLTTEDLMEAHTIARSLEEKNTDRKRAVERIIEELETHVLPAGAPEVVFAGSPLWSAGVLGIAANRLMERYGRPVFLYEMRGTVAKGSCRSPDGLNVVSLMRSAEEYFLDFGGHESAGGFSFAPEYAVHIHERITKTVATQIGTDTEPSAIIADLEIGLSDVRPRLFDETRMLAPFGQGNEAPRFLIRNVPISDLRPVGKDGTHLKLWFGETRIPAIYFGGAARGFRRGDRTDIIAALQKNVWNGTTTIELRVVDMKKCET